jgi:hypothetical protein
MSFITRSGWHRLPAINNTWLSRGWLALDPRLRPFDTIQGERSTIAESVTYKTQGQKAYSWARRREERHLGR